MDWRCLPKTCADLQSSIFNPCGLTMAAKNLRQPSIFNFPSMWVEDGCRKLPPLFNLQSTSSREFINYWSKVINCGLVRNVRNASNMQHTGNNKNTTHPPCGLYFVRWLQETFRVGHRTSSSVAMASIFDQTFDMHGGKGWSYGLTKPCFACVFRCFIFGFHRKTWALLGESFFVESTVSFHCF